MEKTTQYVSPDGLLTLNVRPSADGTIVRFNDFAWNTSSQFLASKWGITEQAAVARFVAEVLGSKVIIAVARAGLAIRDVWVTDRPASELKYKRHEEAIVFRFWDGTRWSSEEPNGIDL